MLNDIQINTKNIGHLNAEYARCRAAIDAELGARSERRSAKMAVIQLLGGKVCHPKEGSGLRNFVQFPDNTKAVF